MNHLCVFMFLYFINFDKILKYTIMLSDDFMFPYDNSKSLKDFDPDYTEMFTTKPEATSYLESGIKKLRKLHEKLYAYNKYALLIIFQAMDAAGKDGTIKHVMSGVNPQGCHVKSFRAPSEEELDHGFLWRCFKELPERGKIGIFNRSYYEEVLVVRVHTDILKYKQKIPNLPHKVKNNGKFWEERYTDINNFEQYLENNGIIVLKFFLNLSKEEQKNRFLSRIDDPDKNWKISVNDFKERPFWGDYMHAYEEMLKHTSTKQAPWYVIPANKKWFMRAAVCDIIVNKLISLDLHFPKVSKQQKAEIQKARELLLGEE